MSLSIDGVWKSGVWAQTVWADGVWREGVAVQPVVDQPSGGWFMRPTRKVKEEEEEERHENVAPVPEAQKEPKEAHEAPVKVLRRVIDAGPIKRAAVQAARTEVNLQLRKRRRDAEMLLLLS